ncbi:MAG: hypothetical protein C5B54_08795 [Acidobacteria bacterium]|nr:MAG: hypothetical protein C5B54_08795 [Acidobacteriota bacterium]
MRITIPVDEAQAETYLPEVKADASGVGINYADQILKPFKLTLADGRKFLAKRKGLKITITIGDKQGDAILRRLDHGPGVKNMFRKALEEAARNVGASVLFEPNTIHLDLE